MRYELYSGAGNTFAILEEPISSREAVLICETSGVDGVIFSENGLRMRIFNRDGSEAEMCGNGLRCFIKFLMEHNIDRECYTIETQAGTHKAWTHGKSVCVEFPSPKDFLWNLSIGPYTVHHLNTGVPHAVLFVDSIDAIDLMGIAPPIRRHPLFPEGTNVNFVDPETLRMRTYERGVERETLACGTGAVASALAAAKVFSLPSPLEMEVRSKEKLKISFTPDWSHVTMEGPANRIGEGTLELKEESRILST
ncbi:MAG: diaminopimelate epimerase [Chlamydiales bacterium]|nr:diaminopimelate epimerase [Chlamydiales bacterium]